MLNQKHLLTVALKVASNVREKSLHRNFSSEERVIIAKAVLQRNYCKALKVHHYCKLPN